MTTSLSCVHSMDCQLWEVLYISCFSLTYLLVICDEDMQALQMVAKDLADVTDIQTVAAWKAEQK